MKGNGQIHYLVLVPCHRAREHQASVTPSASLAFLGTAIPVRVLGCFSAFMMKPPFLLQTIDESFISWSDRCMNHLYYVIWNILEHFNI